MIGFVRVMGNLGVLLTWIVLAAYLMSHEAYFSSHSWVANRLAAKTACVTGVALGTSFWFFILSYSVSRGHGKFSGKACCACNTSPAFASCWRDSYGGIHVIWQLTRHLV